MIELNVVLKLNKHIIECVEPNINKHTFHYKIKRIEIFKEHYLIKSLYPTIEYEKYYPLILTSKNNPTIINDFVIHHFILNEKTVSTYITPLLPNEYNFFYDYKHIDNIAGCFI